MAAPWIVSAALLITAICWDFGEAVPDYKEDITYISPEKYAVGGIFDVKCLVCHTLSVMRMQPERRVPQAMRVARDA
eukprot:scaffold533559_cov37-Prasinocladus_malaysianus.AAC.1